MGQRQHCFAGWDLLSVVVVCRRSASSVTLTAGGRAGRRARGRSGGRHCTAGQYSYVPLGRHLVETSGIRNTTHHVTYHITLIFSVFTRDEVYEIPMLLKVKGKGEGVDLYRA